MVPCWGDVGLSGPGGVILSGSVGRYDEERAGAEVGRSAACAETGWSVGAAIVVLAKAEVT